MFCLKIGISARIRTGPLELAYLDLRKYKYHILTGPYSKYKHTLSHYIFIIISQSEKMKKSRIEFILMKKY